jgi:predicted lipoprotein with Yx(FWY)xxD motif
MHCPYTRLRSAAAAAATLALAGVGCATAATAAPAAALSRSAAVAAKPAATSASRGTVIAAVQGPFGRMLVVGSGAFAGFALYVITSDYKGHYGCTTEVMTIFGHSGSCTGASDDASAEWPAITTVGKPVAGPGVNAKLLGSVVRAHVGRQITYAGHPLYLFDQSPGQVGGEDWDEPSLPPWHGVWTVLSPSGHLQPWPGMLTVTKIGRREVLAALMETGVGFLAFPVYAYSKDGRRSSACSGSCARAWPPLITSGRPGLSAGLRASRLATFGRSGGLTQVTYEGHPLYLYSNEGIQATSSGYRATGSGNGITANGGTFTLITL